MKKNSFSCFPSRKYAQYCKLRYVSYFRGGFAQLIHYKRRASEEGLVYISDQHHGLMKPT